MMRHKRILILIWLLLIAFWAGAQDRNYSGCLTKKNSIWGQPCANCEAYTADLKRDHSGTYQVDLQNTCGDVIEVKVALEEKGGIWRTFPVKALAPGEQMNAYACLGTGKYMYWVRRANDSEIVLPTDSQILTEYRIR